MKKPDRPFVPHDCPRRPHVDALADLNSIEDSTLSMPSRTTMDKRSIHNASYIRLTFGASRSTLRRIHSHILFIGTGQPKVHQEEDPLMDDVDIECKEKPFDG